MLPPCCHMVGSTFHFAAQRHCKVTSVPWATSLQALEGRLWEHQHPLRQFGNALSPELLFKIEDRGLALEQLEVRLPKFLLHTLSRPYLMGRASQMHPASAAPLHHVPYALAPLASHLLGQVAV